MRRRHRTVLLRLGDYLSEPCNCSSPFLDSFQAQMQRAQGELCGLCTEEMELGSEEAEGAVCQKGLQSSRGSPPNCQLSTGQCMRVRNHVRLGRPPDGVKAGSSALAPPTPGLYLLWGAGHPGHCRVLTAFWAPTHLLILAAPAVTTENVSREDNGHLLGTTE